MSIKLDEKDHGWVGDHPSPRPQPTAHAQKLHSDGDSQAKQSMSRSYTRACDCELIARETRVVITAGSCGSVPLQTGSRRCVTDPYVVKTYYVPLESWACFLESFTKAN